MIEVNISRDKDYFIQRNNRLFPYSSCNTTSIINALTSAGIPYPTKEGVQPEDDLTSITERQDYYDEKTKLGFGPGVTPREVYSLLAKATNEFIGKEVARLKFKQSPKDFAWAILTGNPVVVGGLFITRKDGTKGGHIVTLQGLKYDGDSLPKSYEEIDEKKILSWIVDDPYGNYFTNYADARGNDIEFPYQTLLDILRKEFGMYYGIYFRKEGWA